MLIVTMDKPFHELAKSGDALDGDNDALIHDGAGTWYTVFPQGNEAFKAFEKCANILRQVYSEVFGYLSSDEDRFTKFYCYNTETNLVTHVTVELFDEPNGEGMGWRFA